MKIGDEVQVVPAKATRFEESGSGSIGRIESFHLAGRVAKVAFPDGSDSLINIHNLRQV